MRLSTRTRYGIRAIFELACLYKSGPVGLKVIAQRQGISVKYLEHLFSIMKNAGFVKGVRGPAGGYILARPPDQIKVSDCFTALEGQSFLGMDCTTDIDSCSWSRDCVVREIWVKLDDAIGSVLQSITLQDLVEKAKGKGQNYQI